MESCLTEHEDTKVFVTASDIAKYTFNSKNNKKTKNISLIFLNFTEENENLFTNDL